MKATMLPGAPFRISGGEIPLEMPPAGKLPSSPIHGFGLQKVGKNFDRGSGLGKFST